MPPAPGVPSAPWWAASTTTAATWLSVATGSVSQILSWTRHAGQADSLPSRVPTSRGADEGGARQRARVLDDRSDRIRVDVAVDLDDADRGTGALVEDPHAVMREHRSGRVQHLVQTASARSRGVRGRR